MNAEKLYQLMSRQTVTIRFKYGGDWCTFKSWIKNGIIILSVFDFNHYVPLYYLPVDNPSTPLLDSPANRRTDQLTSSYLLRQGDRLIKYLLGQMDIYELSCIDVTPIVYCKYCKRELKSYKSMLRGYGPTCSELTNSHLLERRRK